MQVVILGAGVVGITAAWYLAADGHQVTVIDRQPAPALETSFANGGQISVSHAEPWATPAAPLKILKWLGQEDAPLLWRLQADPAQLAWGLRFLRQCTAARTRANIQAIVGLGLHSRAALGALRRELCMEYDQLERGILHFYTDTGEFERALPQAAVMREFGCERLPKSAQDCLAIEPARAQSTLPIVGGTYTADDESGDAQQFTRQLAEQAAQRGVRFRYGTNVHSLVRRGRAVTGVRLSCGEIIAAEATVVALGSYSSAMLAPLGVSLPLYPAKGYSATVTLAEPAWAPVVSLTDDGGKLVFSRLGGRLRIAGTAEFCGYDISINPQRCAALMRRASSVFPQLRVEAAVEYWAGLRPATPGNVPLICHAAHVGVPGLWLNTGHGTLGWTLSCGSGQLLADLLAEREAVLDPLPYRL